MHKQSSFRIVCARLARRIEDSFDSRRKDERTPERGVKRELLQDVSHKRGERDGEKIDLRRRDLIGDVFVRCEIESSNGYVCDDDTEVPKVSVIGSLCDWSSDAIQ